MHAILPAGPAQEPAVGVHRLGGAWVQQVDAVGGGAAGGGQRHQRSRQCCGAWTRADQPDPERGPHHHPAGDVEVDGVVVRLVAAFDVDPVQSSIGDGVVQLLTGSGIGASVMPTRVPAPSTVSSMMTRASHGRPRASSSRRDDTADGGHHQVGFSVAMFSVAWRSPVGCSVSVGSVVPPAGLSCSGPGSARDGGGGAGSVIKASLRRFQVDESRRLVAIKAPPCRGEAAVGPLRLVLRARGVRIAHFDFGGGLDQRQQFLVQSGGELFTPFRGDGHRNTFGHDRSG